MIDYSELLLYIILLLGYGGLCYLCGKGDLLNLIPLMLQEKAKEIEERMKEEGEEND